MIPSYLTRSPSGYTCTHNYRITTSIHINTITTLSDPTSTSLLRNTGTNSFFSPSVCSLLLSLPSVLHRVISRVILLHHIIFRSRPLLLVSKSLPTCSLFHLDHNRTSNAMVFVSTIRNEMSTIPTIHRSIRRQVNQQSTTFIWLK